FFFLKKKKSNKSKKKKKQITQNKAIICHNGVINELHVNSVSVETSMYTTVFEAWNNATYLSMYTLQTPQINANLFVNCASHFPCRYHYYLRIANSTDSVYDIALAHAFPNPHLLSAIIPYFGSSSIRWKYYLIGCVETNLGALHCLNKEFKLSDNRGPLFGNTENDCVVADFVQHLTTLLSNAQDHIMLSQFVTKVFVELTQPNANSDATCIRNIIRVLITAVSDHLLTDYFQYVN
ncbi:hypothetical protein RFI_27109, partial [Reticulomyxa filosa]